MLKVRQPEANRSQSMKFCVHQISWGKLDTTVPFAVGAAQVEIPHLSLGLQAHI